MDTVLINTVWPIQKSRCSAIYGQGHGSNLDRRGLWSIIDMLCSPWALKHFILTNAFIYFLRGKSRGQCRFLGSFGQPAPGPRAHILDLMASTLRWEVSLALSDMQGTEFTEQWGQRQGLNPSFPDGCVDFIASEEHAAVMWSWLRQDHCGMFMCFPVCNPSLLLSSLHFDTTS